MVTPLKEAKAYLSARGIDFSDCFERSELLERFQSVKLSCERGAIEKAKLKANAAFKRKSHAYAIRLYTEAIGAACKLQQFDDAAARKLCAVLLTNRSFAYLQLQMPRRALRDAHHSATLDPDYIKAHEVPLPRGAPSIVPIAP